MCFRGWEVGEAGVRISWESISDCQCTQGARACPCTGRCCCTSPGFDLREAFQRGSSLLGEAAPPSLQVRVPLFAVGEARPPTAPPPPAFAASCPGLDDPITIVCYFSPLIVLRPLSGMPYREQLH